MTAYSYSGFAIARDASDNNVAAQALDVKLFTLFGNDSFTYAIAPDSSTDADRFSTVTLDLEALSISGNGRSFDLDDPFITASVGVASWGTSNETVVLTLVFFEDDASFEYVIALGGTPLPTITSFADMQAFDGQVTSIGQAPLTGPLAPGATINFSALPTAVLATSDIVEGTVGDDILTGAPSDDVILPLSSNGLDVIIGSAGNDTIISSDVELGNFTTFDYGDLNAPVTVNLDVDPEVDSGLGSYTAEVLKGVNGTDTLIDVDRAMSWQTGDGIWFGGTDFNDTFNINAPGGSNWIGLWGGDGVDSFTLGDAGAIRLSYLGEGVTSGAVVDLTTGIVANDGFGNAETITILPGAAPGIEVAGTYLNDSITGSDNDERFILNQGNDTLDGGGGSDLLRYDRTGVENLNVNLATGVATGTWGGESFIHTISNIEEVRGSDGADDVITGGSEDGYFEGGGGDDIIKGGAGNDTIVGGEGADTAVFDVLFADATVTVSGFTATVSSAGDGTDAVWGVEYLRFADQTVDAFSLEPVDVGGPTNGNDSLDGTPGNDFIEGLDGNDTINGFGGNDVLVGGAGNDLINPGDNIRQYDIVVPGTGNDTVDLGNVVNGYVEITHDTLDAGISVILNAAANTGLINKGTNGETLVFDARNAILADGLAIGGTFFDDQLIFTHSDTAFGYLEYIAVGGSNSITALGGMGTVRLNYYNGDSGIIANLTSGIIQNSSGGIDTLTDSGTDTQIEIRGTLYADNITGSNKGERFILEGGSDTLDAGGGFDMVRYDRSGVESVVVNLAANSAVGTWYGVDFIHTIRNVEAVRGSSTGDVLSGNAASNELYGYDGNDVINGRAGNDMLDGGAGDDMLTGGAGNDTVMGGDGSDTAVIADALRTSSGSLNIVIGETAEGLTIRSAEGNDLYGADVETFMFSDAVISRADLLALLVPTITGTNIAENVNGTDLSEMINAGGGGDWITPGEGSDTIDGGDGNDMLSFVTLADTPGRTNVQYRLDLDLTAGTATTSGSDVYTISNVERVTGSIFADRIKGDAGDNQLRGLGDYDWFTATTGADTIDGGTGQDMISYVDWLSDAVNTADTFNPGGAPPPNGEVTGVVVDLNDTSNNTNLAAGHEYISVERVTGSGRQDVFYGDENENDFRGLGDFDWFVGSTGGRERYFGGDGGDTVTYYNSTSGVSASLRNGAKVGGEETGRGTAGDAALDLYFSIENLVGTNFADSLTGNEQRNNLNGLNGDDFIFGYGGIDVMKGGKGNDVINGGAGSDYALFDGNKADYDIFRTASNEVRTSGADGFDIHTDVEYFRFSDGDVTIWELAIV